MALLLLLAQPTIWGQAAATGSILGKVSDPSGAMVSGVTVTVTSTALQVPSVTATTDGSGDYVLRDLPAPGTYQLKFERTGFQVLVRENVNLPTGFTARVDANLTVGAVAQAVTVTGESPVVDTVDSGRELTIPQQDLQTLPRGGGFQELFQLTPGVSIGGKPDVGDSNLGARANLGTYGAVMNMSIRWEGLDITSDSHDWSTVMYISAYNLAEVQTKATGNGGEIAVPGFYTDSIVKSGSNQTHGDIIGEYQPGEFQGNNVTPALAAQGITATNPLQYYYTAAGDLGGYLVKNKLWYYGGYSRQAMVTGDIGVVSGPDANGCWLCTDAPSAMLPTSISQYTAKFNYQPKENLRFIGVWTRGLKWNEGTGASLTTPFPSSNGQSETTTLFKGEMQWTVTPRLVINVLSGDALSETQFFSPNPTVQGFPSSQEVSNKLVTGPGTTYTQATPSAKIPLNVNFVYAKGKHNVKFGTDLILHNYRDLWYGSRYPGPGDYQLLFNLGQPYEVVTYNDPVTPSSMYHSQALFAEDTWKIKRLSLAYGVRWDRYDSFYPDQSKAAGQLSAAQSVQGQDVLTWKDFLPRVGATWDLFGKGRTVVKGSFGIFGDEMMAGWAGSYDPLGRLSTTYTWSGPCVKTAYNNVSYTQPNTSCDIDPTYLASLSPSSPNYVSSTGGSTVILNTSLLPQPKIYEYTGRIEHELFANTAVAFGYVHYTQYRNLWPAGTLGGLTSAGASSVTTSPSIYPNRPYSAYSVVVPVTDPMTNNTVNFYTYPSSYSGPMFNLTEKVSPPDDRPDNYDTLEVTVTRRFANRWNALASFWTTKNDRWLTPVASNPNLSYFAWDGTRSWEARLSGTYKLPWNFELDGLYRATSGVLGQRTLQSASKLLLQGSTTVPVEAYGSQQGPVLGVANIRLGRTTRLGDRWSVETSGEVFNAFNSSAAIAYSWLTGTTYGRVTGIVNPRVVRVSATLRF